MTTGRELFDRYAPELLARDGWDAQPPGVQRAWDDIAAGVTRELRNAGRIDAQSVAISTPRQCDVALCGEQAEYDAKTVDGPWANLCPGHFKKLGVGLGTGRGQRLVLVQAEAPEDARGGVESSDGASED